MGEFLEVQSATIDGVETFWTDVVRPTTTATLVFRAGMADETLITSGWLHLLEHLAVHGRDTPTLSVNASVGLLQTRFDLAGPASEVAAALSDLTAWFAEPDLSKAHDEARVLRAESEWRGTSPAAAAMLERFGAAGPGLSGHSEPGLSRAHPAALHALCRKYFTAGNAVLALSSPPPADLRLHLRHGFRMVAPPAIELPGPKPAAYAHGKDGVVASGIVPRTAAATILPNVLQRAFHEKLRNVEGAAYAPWATYEPVDEERAVIVAGSDFRQELHPRLMELTRSALDVARNPEWLSRALQDLKASHRQAHADPRAAEGLAVRAAYQALRGQPIQPWEDVLEEIEAISPSELAELVTTFHQTLLLGVPGRIPWNNELPLNQMETGSVVEGASQRSRAFLADKGNLTVGREGVSISSPAVTRTVRFQDLEGMYAYADGARMLVRRDGWFITVEPKLWNDGERAVAAIDAAVPQQLVLPMPSRPAEQVPQPPTLATQFKHLHPTFRKWLFIAIYLVLLVVTLYFAIRYDFLSSLAGPMVALAAAGLLAERGQRKREERRQRKLEKEQRRNTGP